MHSNAFIFRFGKAAGFIILLFLTGSACGQDPFLPYLTGKPPLITEDLGTETTSEGLRIHQLVFQSRMMQGTGGPKPVLVYAAIVHPAGAGFHPAILRLHGGGGNADIPAAISSAKEGYVSLVLDIPAIAGKGKNPKSNFPDSRTKISATPDASYSGLFDSVLAAVQSFYLLRAQPDVDKNRIAIAGSSWGGYTATMAASLLDKDVAATYAAYGSGNFLLGAYEKQNIERLPETERMAWLNYLDPGKRAHQITKPFILATASNDRHWSWMAVQATLAQMKGPVQQFYSPNDNHQMKYPGSALMIPFFNQYLKGGPHLPAVVLNKTARLKDGSLQVSYRVKDANHLVASRVYYTYPSDQPVWTERKWSFVEAVPKDAAVPAARKYYQAVIPAAAGKLNWYVLVTDHHPKLGKDTVSVSSLIQETEFEGHQSSASKSQPVIFNSNESAGAGEVFAIQGADFGAAAEVWCTVVSDKLKSLQPVRKLRTVSSADGNLSALIPHDPAFKPGVLIAVWVKRISDAVWSQPVFLNRARAVSLEYDQIMPGQAFRVFGRNLKLRGYAPRLSFVDVKTRESIPATVISGDPFVLKLVAPRTIRPGNRYQLLLSNGNGGHTAGAETTSEELITAVKAAADPFGLKVPWGSEFIFYRNIYNVKSDSRLLLKAKGDGLADDRKAIQQAIDLASRSGGGVVYFPEGKYKLDIPSGTGLIMKTGVVLKGDGDQKSFIQYGFGTPPSYPDPIGKDGWPNATTEGVAILWPVNTSLTGLYQLCLQNVNTSGLWRHSLKTMPPPVKKPGGSGSKFFAANCRFDFSVAWGLSWGYVDRMIITDCIFDSQARVTWPWLLHCSGSTNFVVRNNQIRYAAGRFGFNDSYNGIIENNQITRLGDLINPKGETGGFNIDFARDIVVLNNKFGVEGKVIPDLNQGETILSQGGNPEKMSVGQVSSATANTLTDVNQTWGQIRTPSLSSSDAVAIVYGRGIGQWRHVEHNTSQTLVLTRPWDVIPDKTSRYAIMHWSAEDWLVKDNILEDNNRGIWFYCGSTDVAVTGNKLNNSEGIYIRSDQRLIMGRYNLSWGISVTDNKVINTNGLRPAFICNVLAIGTKPDTLFGTGSIGVEIRRNLVQAHQPNSGSFVRGEGYFNEVLPRNQADQLKPGVKGVVSTIFENNTVLHADIGYRLYGPVDQTIVKDAVFKGVQTPVASVAGTVVIEKGGTVSKGEQK